REFSGLHLRSREARCYNCRGRNVAFQDRGDRRCFGACSARCSFQHRDDIMMRTKETMTQILLVGTELPLLEGLAQTFRALGLQPVVAQSLREARETAV